MAPPSLCGSFLTNKRSLVAFTWSLTTVLTLIAFALAIVFTAHVHAHYVRMEKYYTELMEYNHQQARYNEDGEEEEYHSSDDREMEMYLQLGRINSQSMAFVSIVVAVVAMGLSLYGSTTIVGFTSMRGVYIAPCFSPSGHSPTLKIGMFGGAIVMFANVLLVCAIVLGEVRVEDWSNHNREEDREDGNDNNNGGQQQLSEAYEIERIATILAVTCMFLAPLYIIFAVLLFFFYGDTNEDTPETSFYLDGSTAAAPTTPRYHRQHPSQLRISSIGTTTMPRIGTDPRSMIGGSDTNPRRTSFLGGGAVGRGGLA